MFEKLLWRLAGVAFGGVIGIALAAFLGDPIGRAFNVSNFEGGRGYFVFLVLIPLFAIVGAVLGAIMIYQGWRFNLSVLALLLLLAGGFAFINREIFLGFPYQTEKFGNFELQSYESESYGDHYGLRYRGKRFDVEEQAGKEERKQRVNTVVLITPPATAAGSAAPLFSAPLFLLSVGEPHDTRRFYIAGEKEGAAFANYLCETTIDAVDALDQQPEFKLASSIEPFVRNIYLHRKEIAGSRWLLLGKGCVLDLQTLTPYPFTPLPIIDSVHPALDEDHLPIALSPDTRSLVQLVVSNIYDAQSGYEHLGHSLHLIVNNFVDDTSYMLAIDPQRMRFNRQPAHTGWSDDINQQWLDHHFTWQKGGDGSDRLVEREQFTPWPRRGWVHGYDNDLEFQLTYVKAEMIDELEAFLVARFAAKRLNREHQAEGETIRTSVELQIEDKVLTLVYDSDPYSNQRVSLWQSAPDQRNGAWLRLIAQAVNEQLRSGVYDELFLTDPSF